MWWCGVAKGGSGGGGDVVVTTVTPKNFKFWNVTKIH
jgi:hypothetical protein